MLSEYIASIMNGVYLGESHLFKKNLKYHLNFDGQMTYFTLEGILKTLEDDDVANYVNKVLSTLDVTIGPSHELMVKTDNEKTAVYAIGRLYQAIILLSYLDLQFEYEDEE